LPLVQPQLLPYAFLADTGIMPDTVDELVFRKPKPGVFEYLAREPAGFAGDLCDLSPGAIHTFTFFLEFIGIFEYIEAFYSSNCTIN
jgi:hypothetical protein